MVEIKPKRILITGANGFIASHYLNALEAKHIQVIRASRIAGDDKNSLEFELSSPPKVETIRELNLDAVVHLAWQDLKNYQDDKQLSDYYQQHESFLKRVIQAGVKKIQVFGTCYEYGDVDGRCDETQEAQPHLKYARAKQALYDTINLDAQKSGVNFQWLRLFYTFGVGQRESSFVPQLIKACLSGQKEFPMSGGEQRFDFILVDYATELAAQLLQLDKSGIYNLSSGKATSLKELANKILARLNPDMKLKLGHYPYNDWEPKNFYGNNSKILADTHSTLRLAIDDQLDKFISDGLNIAKR